MLLLEILPSQQPAGHIYPILISTFCRTLKQQGVGSSLEGECIGHHWPSSEHPSCLTAPHTLQSMRQLILGALRTSGDNSGPPIPDRADVVEVATLTKELSLPVTIRCVTHSQRRETCVKVTQRAQFTWPEPFIKQRFFCEWISLSRISRCV